MVVAGIMSGTSADGVDVALCRISPPTGQVGTPRIKLLGHAGYSYPKDVRAAVLAAMDAKSTSVADLSRLNWRLGELYADAVAKAQTKFGVQAQLVGCHGQTLYHQSVASKYLGAPVRCTWQTGEANVIAERLRVPVVSDFRPSDMAAGGQGAPLVPMLDYVMFRSAKVNRTLQNLGGIGNLTAIPAGPCSHRQLPVGLQKALRQRLLLSEDRILPTAGRCLRPSILQVQKCVPGARLGRERQSRRSYPSVPTSRKLPSRLRLLRARGNPSSQPHNHQAATCEPVRLSPCGCRRLHETRAPRIRSVLASPLSSRAATRRRERARRIPGTPLLSVQMCSWRRESDRPSAPGGPDAEKPARLAIHPAPTAVAERREQSTECARLASDVRYADQSGIVSRGSHGPRARNGRAPIRAETFSLRETARTLRRCRST